MEFLLKYEYELFCLYFLKKNAFDNVMYLNDFQNTHNQTIKIKNTYPCDCVIYDTMTFSGVMI